jgi:glycosyltransferase involved in cell wall biosynthesis
MKIAISTKDFIHLSGARDFLRNVIRGVKTVEYSQVYILADISVALTEQDKANTELFQRLIELLNSHINSSEFTIQQHQQVCTEFDAKLAQPIKEKLCLWFGAEIIEGTQLIVYSGERREIDRVCIRNGIDVVIPTTYWLATPFVSYLYDCQHKHIPSNFSKHEIDARDSYFSQQLKYSPAVIVNSKDVKNDLMAFYNASESAIFSLPFTPQLSIDALSPDPVAGDQYSIPAKYFLVSNQFWIHKSLETTILALRKLIDEGVSDAHIVFTGEMHDSRFPDYVASLIELVNSMKLSNSTTFLGYIPKRHQLEILKNAVAVLQPTLFEGGPGGGSVYDSEAFGVRSIVSDIPVNRELPIGDRVVLFETKNPLSLAEKMRQFWFTNYVRPSNTELVSNDESRLLGYVQSLQNALNYAIETRTVTLKKQVGKLISGNIRITVITVIKNAATILGKTIDSVLKQAYKNIEFIIVDGGSDDSTKDIVKAYGEAITYICEPDDGIYDAMNKGVKASTGDFLYFLNAGDELQDEHVFTDIVSVFKDPKYLRVDFFYGNLQFIRGDGSYGRYLEYREFPFFYYSDNCQCHQVCFYRKKVFDLYGIYDTSFKIYGDHEFNARIVVKNSVKSMHLSRTIVRYLEGGFSEQMMSTGLNFEEKERIKKLYFGDTPNWFFERLKGDYAAFVERTLKR